jgi:hypothetical protein
MRRRKLLGALAAGVVVLLAAGAFVLWLRSGRVTEENFRRIRRGMTLAQVEAILGPASVYRTHTVEYSRAELWMDASNIFSPGLVLHEWRKGSLRIDVGFAPLDGKDRGEYTVMALATPTPFESYLWSVRREWRDGSRPNERLMLRGVITCAGTCCRDHAPATEAALSDVRVDTATAPQDPATALGWCRSGE